jgi:hypothetical protein
LVTILLFILLFFKLRNKKQYSWPT